MTVNGQTPVMYGYDANLRLTQVSQGTQTVNLGYDLLGRRTTLTYPNGTNTTYSYDNASRITQVLYQGPGSVIDALAYTYDAVGNRIGITRMNRSATLLPDASQYAYDGANEQIQFNSPTANLAYDSDGNLISQTGENGTTNYTWDGRNRLVSIAGPGLTASFSYDVFGRRISKSVNGNMVKYLYDGSDIVSEIGEQAVAASYLRGLDIDEPFIRQSTSNEFYHSDILGSILELSDQVGGVETTYSYEPFGSASLTGQSASSFQYTGRENDQTGLYYYRTRYYSPALKRFISEDPMEARGSGTNPYAYVGNNPISFADPLGLCQDPGGPGIRYCIQTYIPEPYALGFFKGDDRGPTCNDPPNTQNFRTYQWIKETSWGNDIGTRVGITRDIFGGSAPGFQGPVFSKELSGRKRGFKLFNSARNGRLESAPFLWYAITINEEDSGNVSVTGSSSGFPNIEVCQYGGPNGTKSINFPHMGDGLLSAFNLYQVRSLSGQLK